MMVMLDVVQMSTNLLSLAFDETIQRRILRLQRQCVTDQVDEEIAAVGWILASDQTNHQIHRLTDRVRGWGKGV